MTGSCSRELLVGLWRDAKSADLIRVLAEGQPKGRKVEVEDRVEQLRPVRNWCRSEKRAELCGDGLMAEIDLCIGGAVPPVPPETTPRALAPPQLQKVCGDAWRGLWSSPALFWNPATATALAEHAFGSGRGKSPLPAIRRAQGLADEAIERPEPPLPGVSVLFFDQAKPFNGGFAGFLGVLLSAVLATLGAPFWYDLLGRMSRRGSAGSKP